MANLNSRAGHYTARAYVAEYTDGRRIEMCDTLVDALDAAEMAADPHWEPS